MSSLEELKDALRDTLAARGSLGQIQARVRAEIFNALEETDDPKPPLSHENLVLNELIREYLEYNHYKHTVSVFTPETGQPAERINRTFLAQIALHALMDVSIQELGLREDGNSRQVPLLYTILARLQHERQAPSSYAPANAPHVGTVLEVPGGGKGGGGSGLGAGAGSGTMAGGERRLGGVGAAAPGGAGGAGGGGTGYSDVRAIKDPPPLTWK